LVHTKVVIIAGNHDYIGEHSRYKEFQWCQQVVFLGDKELECIYIPEASTTIYGFSYHQRDITESKYDSIVPSKEKGFHILLAHGGDEKNIPMNRRLIEVAGFDYVALGHIHKPEGFGKAMAYSGSLEPLDRNETGNHGYILGELSEQSQCNITFVPYSVRQYYHLEIEIDQDMVKGTVVDLVKERVNHLGRQHIYKIILAGIRDPELHFLESDFLTIGNIVEFQDNTIPDYDFEQLQYQNRDNMIGMFIEAIRACGEKDEIADKALYYGMEALRKNK
jgi:DNA repair exonuclease SbcCD nuclease subunit